LPPLRERREEIALFTDHFMQRAAKKFARKPLAISNALRDALSSYAWPGNLRELENIINRHLIIGDERLILAALDSGTNPAPILDQCGDSSMSVSLRQHIRKLKGSAESAAIADALKETKWNRRAAARLLDMSYSALRYKIKHYDLN